MIYLNEATIREFDIDWQELVTLMANAVRTLDTGDFSQPIKPYLRFRNPKNRIISMPAYLGGSFDIAGIKWIASFPDNIHGPKPRAHSVVILNDTATGEPVCIINTALLSVIRTAAVSGLMLSYFDKARQPEDITVAIMGWGPIGRYHLRMCMGLLGNRIAKVLLYDVRGIDPATIEGYDTGRIAIADSWQEAYDQADVFITCTTAASPYINRAPKPASLHLNVSLRDYQAGVHEYFKNAIIVDNWEEVCRENTNIENMHKEKGLVKEDTHCITDIVLNEQMERYPKEASIMFNPMGMGIFDIALGKYYLNKAGQVSAGMEI